MKIYFVDKYNTLNKFIKEFDFENIERKEDCHFRMTKNDYVIFSDENDFDGLDKLKNIIILVKSKDYKHIWRLVTDYKTLDVIDIDMPTSYVAKRINRLVCEEV